MFVDAIKSLLPPEPERSEQSNAAIWTWISRSGFRFGSEALTNPLRDRGNLDRAQFGVGGAGVTVGIERRPTAAGERDGSAQRQHEQQAWGGHFRPRD